MLAILVALAAAAMALVPMMVSAQADPHALTVPNVTQSLRDNEDFDTYGFPDTVRVVINPDNGQVTLSTRAFAGGNVAMATATAASVELVALKAIRGWYPDATAVETDVSARLSNGEDPEAAMIVVSFSTASGWDLGALMQRIDGDPESLFCLADHYGMAAQVWAATGHFSDCLTSRFGS